MAEDAPRTVAKVEVCPGRDFTHRPWEKERRQAASREETHRPKAEAGITEARAEQGQNWKVSVFPLSSAHETILLQGSFS